MQPAQLRLWLDAQLAPMHAGNVVIASVPNIHRLRLLASRDSEVKYYTRPLSLMFCVLSIHLIVSWLAVFNLSNTVGGGSAQACRTQKNIFIDTQMSRLSCRMGIGMWGNCELLNGKMGMGFKFQTEMGWDVNKVIETGGIWYQKMRCRTSV